MSNLYILRKLILILFILFSNSNATSGAKNAGSPLSGLGKNFIASYTGWNSFYHAAAIGVTIVAVNTGFDAAVLETTAEIDPNLASSIGHTGIFLGYIAPLAVPATMYLISGQHNPDLRRASYAVMQAVGMAFIAGTMLKAITGRSGPDPDAADKSALSKEFKFGFMRGGFHYGWPSGHLMVNTAMAATIAAYYREKTWVQVVSYGYISFLAVSVLIHDRGSAHWFSDIVAGTLMGFAFGTTVGKYFCQQRQANDVTKESVSPGGRIQLLPIIDWEYSGLVCKIYF